MVIGAGNALISVSLMIMPVAGSQILIVPVAGAAEQIFSPSVGKLKLHKSSAKTDAFIASTSTPSRLPGTMASSISPNGYPQVLRQQRLHPLLFLSGKEIRAENVPFARNLSSLK